MFIKIHKSYRNVVAICDSILIGKKFEEGKKQLFVRENFYKGEEYSEEEAIKIMQIYYYNDSTFNIVGKESIALALKVKIIVEGNIEYIEKIPFALSLI